MWHRRVQHSLQGKAVLTQFGEENLHKILQRRGQQDVYNKETASHKNDCSAHSPCSKTRPSSHIKH